MAADQPEIPDSPDEQHQSLRKEIVSAFDSLSAVIKAAVAPLPTKTGDGSSIEPPKATGPLKDILHMYPKDVVTLIDLAKDTVTGQPVDDKTFLMERLIQLTSELPSTSKLGNFLSDKFVQQLYDDLEHPPTTFLGEEYKYRAADGSFNVGLDSTSFVLLRICAIVANSFCIRLV